MNQEMADNLNERLRQVSDLIHAGLYDEAKKLLDSFPKDNLNIRWAVSAPLIDLGSFTNDEQMVLEGAGYIEESLVAGRRPENSASDHYNLSNAYDYLFKKNYKGYISCVSDKNKQLAKHHLRLAAKSCSDPVLLKQIYVNLGNCLDELNRGAEALVYYSRALGIDPEMAMAKGNRAMALTRFADISGKYRIAIYTAAYDDLNSVVSAGDITYGGEHAKALFSKAAHAIEKGLGSDLLPVLKSKKRPRHPKYRTWMMRRFERYYIRFCIENHLFLNLHVHHLICSAAVCDPIFIDNRQGAISIELANFVNQIKEDYTTARYIFALSQYKNARFKKINDGVVYASPPNAQSAFSIEDGLMKTSFEEAYSILDKIAAFLNDYYSLNLKFKIYFTGKPPKGFWEKDSGVLRIELLDTKNPSLYALYDIYKDFEDDYKILTDIRNGLAHRKLVITDLGGEASPLAAGKPIEMISPEQMLSETMQLFHVVKSAVIYLINAINLEPRLTKRP